MNTEEIPRDEWIQFLDEFTREHQGWPVNVEVLDEELGAQTQVRDAPLQGISADVRPAGNHNVSIIVGEEQNPSLTHIVPNTRHVRVARSEDGDDEALEIEAADGSRTLVRFQLPHAA